MSTLGIEPVEENSVNPGSDGIAEFANSAIPYTKEIFLKIAIIYDIISLNMFNYFLSHRNTNRKGGEVDWQLMQQRSGN